jgi:colanic acid/amylovoran biosynthesis protein
MDRQELHFLLVGNGPYSNRGCEAIVRGTMVILRHEFGEDFRVTLGTFETPEIVAEQAATETDPLITHVALHQPMIMRWSRPWWRRKLRHCFVPRSSPYAMLDEFCTGASVAMQVGGDNYTLDYGLPSKFIGLDDYLRQRGAPVVLWGASVGPFEADPSFAPEMHAHLRRMRAIFVRESDSYDYLTTHGVDVNLHRMSDPAFVMEPVEPPAERIGCLVPSGAIGLNLSPMMAKYVTGGDMAAWVRVGADIVQTAVEAAGRDVLLVPHVTWARSDDHSFLARVVAACSRATRGRVSCLSNSLSAAETKWMIARCAVFVGARTHSTIAAISSLVPTLSLAYSRKARGLNQDIFANQDYCLAPLKILPAVIAERIVDLLAHRDAIREHLAKMLPGIRESAFRGGAILHRLVDHP